MKTTTKTISTTRMAAILLTVATLLTMLSVFAVSVSAEGATVTPQVLPGSTYQIDSTHAINVTVISANTTSGTVGSRMNGAWSGKNETMDWSSLPLNGFLNNSNGAIPSQIIVPTDDSNNFKIIGRFSVPTTVSSFACKTVQNADRCQNLTFSFSQDGVAWTDIVTTTIYAKGTEGSKILSFTMPEQYADVEYRYVKIEQKTSTTAYTAISGAIFYSHKETPALVATDSVKVADYEKANGLFVIPTSTVADQCHTTYGYIGNNFNSIWVGKNGELDWTNLSLNGFSSGYVSQQIISNSTHQNNVKVVGKFASPTTVHSFAMKTVAATRFADVTVAFSKDGITWDTVAAIVSTSWAGADNVVVTYELSETYADEKYSYVKIEREGTPPEATNVYTQIGGFEFYTESGALNYGTQAKSDSATYSVRFVSTVDSLDFSGVGYKITAVGNGLAEKNWDVTTTTVYSTVYETVNGVDRPVNAPDGMYFFVATIENISIEKYDQITFTVIPYVVLADGKTQVMGDETIYIYQDGVLANA